MVFRNGKLVHEVVGADARGPHQEAVGVLLAVLQRQRVLFHLGHGNACMCIARRLSAGDCIQLAVQCGDSVGALRTGAEDDALAGEPLGGVRAEGAVEPAENLVRRLKERDARQALQLGEVAAGILLDKVVH